jgi:hypothetical protein
MKTIPELQSLLASRTLSHAEEKKLRRDLEKLMKEKKKMIENNQLTII